MTDVVSRPQPITFCAATDKLVDQFARAENFENLRDANGLSDGETAAELTRLVAASFTFELPSPAHAVMYLAGWHATLRADCSEMYRTLRQQDPELSREQANQNPELEILNGIRRGVHRALVREEHALQRRRVIKIPKLPEI